MVSGGEYSSTPLNISCNIIPGIDDEEIRLETLVFSTAFESLP